MAISNQVSPNKSKNKIDVKDTAERQLGAFIIPYIREAVLASITPRLTRGKAGELANRLVKAWIEIHDEYKQKVASAADVGLDYLRQYSGHEPRIHWEGITCVIDYPLLQFREVYHNPFDTRICISICTGKMSTKFWSRVRLPYRTSAMPAVPVDNIEILVQKYRKITSESSDWLYKKTREIIEQDFPDFHFVRQCRLEVSSFGVKDATLQRYFERLSDAEIPILNILQDKEANDKFSFYFNKFCESHGDLRSLTEHSKPDTLFWFTSPIKLAIKDGSIKPHEVLYLMRSTHGKAQAVGLVYDESLSPTVPYRSAMQVSRFIGQRV